MNFNMLLPLLLLLGAGRRRDRHLAREIYHILTNPQFGITDASIPGPGTVPDLVAALDDLLRAREGGQTFRLELLLPFLLTTAQTSAQASTATPAPTTTPAPSDPTLALLAALALADDRP
jgi:hypothetical protein